MFYTCYCVALYEAEATIIDIYQVFLSSKFQLPLIENVIFYFWSELLIIGHKMT